MKERTVYITEDGVQFSGKDLAIKYEQVDALIAGFASHYLGDETPGVNSMDHIEHDIEDVRTFAIRTVKALKEFCSMLFSSSKLLMTTLCSVLALFFFTITPHNALDCHIIYKDCGCLALQSRKEFIINWS